STESSTITLVSNSRFYTDGSTKTSTVNITNSASAYARVSVEEEVPQSQSRLYPNPSNGMEINIQSNNEADEIKSVILSDMVGNVLKSKVEVDKNKAKLYPLQKMKTGTYFIRFQAGNRIFTEKVVVAE
ncbi:MAG: T9SS type A sorting domain-containing protein, partial [Leadbetterella sp.]